MPELNPHIDKFFRTINELSRTMFERTGELRMAMCFMLVDESKIIQIPIPMAGNNYGKDMISSILKIAASQLKPYALTFVSECWVVAEKMRDGATKEQILNEYANKSLENVPNREECIMLVNETKLGSTTVAIPIIRDANGKPSLGEERSTSDATGRFTNLLYDYGTKVN